MKRPRSKPKSNEPIRLSGRVYVDKLLAWELPGLALPGQVQNGDVKLLAIPRGHGYAGFVRAYVFQTPHGWRALSLRQEAASEAIYKGPVERQGRAMDCVKHLRTLKGWTATWGDKTYEVLDIAPPTVTPCLTQEGNASAVALASVTAVTVATQPAAKPAPVFGAHRTATFSSSSRSRPVVKEQLLLF